MSALPIFGLDVGVSSIKVVQIDNIGKTKKLTAIGMIPAPVGGFLSGEDVAIGTVAEAVKKVIRDCKITTKNVNISLPESKIFTRLIEMPPISDEELKSALKWEAEQYIPLALEDVNMDWQVLNRPQNPTPESKMEVLLSAAPKILIDNYIKLADKADLIPVSIEPQTIAVVRSFTTPGIPSPISIVLDMGAEETNLIIVKDGVMVFARTVGTGGNSFTRAIVTKFGLEFVQAEEYKKTYGLEKDTFEGKLSEAIKPLVEILVAEIRRAITFYQTRRPNDIVRRLILQGSPTMMPGLIRYMTEAVGLETQLSDPWVGLEIDRKIFADITAKGPSYGLSVGLAKKEING
jgi:type IV pilus assembly protein PilM